MADVFSLDNPAFSSFAFYSTLCVLKMLAMGFQTAFTRMSKGVFANPEDVAALGAAGKDKKPVLDDADVERSRRNHLNDLENIPAFILVGFLYVAIGPCPVKAVAHFRLFTIARFLHTVAYQLPLPQPSRALCHMVGVLTTVSMAVQVLMSASY